ncbi:hypothetical protein ABQJ54_03765 [Rhodanobacter sp. Si-c]|uniref:Uncharacterized protein n=1 Tax=Rhodanobacter lycopersici TaxID=3162487 RepID=A0ABV3QAJ4_9GAMM
MTDQKTPEQIEIDTLRAHNAELLADLKAAKANAKASAEQVTALTGERDAALAQVRAVTIGQPVQAMAERISNLPDVFIAEIERNGWRFEHDGAGIVLRDADGKPVMLRDGATEREAKFTEADLRTACLQDWKAASERTDSASRFAHLILMPYASGGGAGHSSGRIDAGAAKPAAQARAPVPRGGLR